MILSYIDQEEYEEMMQKEWEEQGFEKGHAEGLAQGLTEGRILSLVSIICKKMSRQCTPQEIAELLEEDLALIQSIYDKALPYAPDFDPQKITDEFLKNR